MELRTSLLRSLILETASASFFELPLQKKKQIKSRANRRYLDLFDYKTGVCVCALFLGLLLTIPLLGFDLTAMWQDIDRKDARESGPM